MIGRAAAAVCAALLAAPVVAADLPPAAVVTAQTRVQTRVTRADDPPGVDQWQPATDRGDCEDYALAKRLELRRRGYAPARLQILFARRTSDGAGHAVLLVDGRWVLDNLHDAVVPMREWTAQWQIVCVVQDLASGAKDALDRCQAPVRR